MNAPPEYDLILTAVYRGRDEARATAKTEAYLLNGGDINLEITASKECPVGDNGGSLLHLAIMYSFYSWARFLINRGIDCNGRDQMLVTPLQLVSRYGILDMLILLHKKGAHIDALDIESATPLMDACINGHCQVVKYLYSAGADICLVEKTNCCNAFMLAINMNQLKVVKYLHSVNAHTEHRAKGGRSPICIACSAGSLKVLKFLVKEGDDINLADYDGNTPLMAAGKTVCKLIHV
jgi:ankyrin repeat protein